MTALLKSNHDLTDHQLKSYLDQAMQQTFEAYFFMDIEVVDRPSIAQAIRHGLNVILQFKGQLQGQLHLHISRETATGLVRSLPMNVVTFGDDLISDLFGEIANTIGGRIAALLAEDRFAFDLTVPEATFEVIKESPARSINRAYLTDFGPVALSLAELKIESKPIAQGA